MVSVHSARGQGFNEGDMYFSGGYGYGNMHASLIRDKDNTARSIGPIYLKAEAGVGKHIGLGLNLSYLNVRGELPIYSDTATQDSSYSYYPIVGWKPGTVYWTSGVQFRMNIHFLSSTTVDPYWGIGLGYRGGRWNRSFSQWSEEGQVFPIGLSTSFGVRVYFMPQLAGYFELGTEKALGQIGLTYRVGVK
jgi:hypothetical protein